MKKIFLLAAAAAFLASAADCAEYFTCTKVFDGDTVQLSNGEKVRLIGVDTPEFQHPAKSTQYYTKQATLFTQKLVENRKIRLEYDPSGQKRDRYRRLLAYVYLEDGTFVNAEIIKKGYGYVYDRFPFEHLDRFREYEKQAKEKEIGLWKGKGELELKWLMRQGREPVKVYAMSNDLWGIEYEKFMKPRVTAGELAGVVSRLSRWTNELSRKDLEIKLLKEGWIKK